MDSIPLHSKELINQLDQEFPHKCPKPDQSERDIWMEAGQRKLIDSLLKRLERQESNILDQKVTENI